MTFDSQAGSGCADAPLSHFSLRPRRVEMCVLLFFRSSRSALESLLPENVHPVVLHGEALVALSYTRVAGRRGRWIADRLGAPVDSLAYRIPVELTGAAAKGELPRRATFVPRRATTSWFEARFGARLLGGRYARARFLAHRDDGELCVQVDNEAREELYLRAGPCPTHSPHALLSDLREVAALLRSTARVIPREPLAPEADALSEGNGTPSIPEPLRVFELRESVAQELGLRDGDLRFDSAFRLQRRQRVPATTARRVRSRNLEHSSLPAT